jgi:hypothetical protein
MKKLPLVLILPCVLFSLTALAEYAPIQAQTQGDVSFVSGGVGIDERAELQAIQANYNLSLLFSEQGGDYLSDVKVHIADASGNVFLDTVSTGPKLYAKLPSGRYIVTVDVEGKVFRKTATVGGKQRTSLSFVWSQESKN